jgi:hypothetical protein
VDDPDEIALAALFLASAQNIYITGTELVVDGGGITAIRPPPVRTAAAKQVNRGQTSVVVV